MARKNEDYYYDLLETTETSPMTEPSSTSA